MLATKGVMAAICDLEKYPPKINELAHTNTLTIAEIFQTIETSPNKAKRVYLIDISPSRLSALRLTTKQISGGRTTDERSIAEDRRFVQAIGEALGISEEQTINMDRSSIEEAVSRIRRDLGLSFSA
jgi:regulator of PEP synthase PpsR (kinase-PPPase family)